MSYCFGNERKKSQSNLCMSIWFCISRCFLPLFISLGAPSFPSRSSLSNSSDMKQVVHFLLASSSLTENTPVILLYSWLPPPLGKYPNLALSCQLMLYQDGLSYFLLTFRSLVSWSLRQLFSSVGRAALSRSEYSRDIASMTIKYHLR